MSKILWLPLAETQTGMTLASDLLDSKGNCILRKGTELTAEIQAALTRRGIEQVPITPPTEAMSPEARQAIENALLDRFGDLSDPVMQRLHAIILKYRLEHP